MNYFFYAWKIENDKNIEKHQKVLELSKQLIDDDATIGEFVEKFLQIGIVPQFSFTDLDNVPDLRKSIINAEYDFNADKEIVNASDEPDAPEKSEINGKKLNDILLNLNDKK